MNNSELVDIIATSHDMTKTDAKKIVDSVFGAIADAAAKGDEVALNGFGKFKVKHTPAREGRSPATGETIKCQSAFNRDPLSARKRDPVSVA